jgi:predicted DNA-binding WGR domain protein
MKANIVLHKQEGTSDKVYIVSIRRTLNSPSFCQFEVVSKWGRRGRKELQSQVKGRYTDEDLAYIYQCELVATKKSNGYKDIESGSYDGPLTMSSPEIVANLESETGKGKPLMEVFKELEAASANVKRAEELICRDNSGMEDRFDKNISYVCEPHPDAGLVYVYDKFGNKGEFLLERFGLFGKVGKAK